MRAMWKGAVSFGLVNVPVRLYSATETHDVSFRQVHREDGGRIKYRRVCAVDGAEVAYDDIAKGYETEDGQMIVITDDDLAGLPNRTSKEIAVERFVPREQIDPMLYDKSYYLEPDKTATKPYALLRDALEAADRVALVTISVRTRMTMAVLRVHEGVILLQTLLWPDEIRSPEFAALGDGVETTAKELAMAHMLVESLAGDYDPSEFEDDYAIALKDMVEAKVAGHEPAPVEEADDDGGQVVDLLEALARSVDRAKAARGEPTKPTGGSNPADAADSPAGPASAATAKKAAPTAKKAAAKASTAKKTAKKATPAAKKTAAKATTATKASTAKKAG